jgi:signal transduction histidine kinase
MQNHRGKISVTSEIGKGTTFTLELPMNLEKLLEKGANDNKAPS